MEDAPPLCFQCIYQDRQYCDGGQRRREHYGLFRPGWNFVYDGTNTTYYPGVGYRYDEYGTFSFTPSGYYWSSAPAPSDTFGAWVFGLTGASIYQRYSDPRGFGLPVRCMKE